MIQRDRARAVTVVLGAGAILFGVLTIVTGGRVLFADSTTQSAAGATVPFVVWFNFLAGFAYVLAGSGLLGKRKWAVALSAAIAAATLFVFAAFGVYVWSGRAYELRTVGAMTLRSIVWIGIAVAAYRLTVSSDARPN